MTAAATPQHSRRIAVFGSVAAQRQLEPDRDPAFSPAARAVLERVNESIASNAPSIARPILDRAVTDGTITRAQRHAMLLALSDPAASVDGPSGSSQGARRTLREALSAIGRAAPTIARPILDEAVGDERLTPAQERRIMERLRSGPAHALRGEVAERFVAAAGG